ncbi:MAG: matrixin family metalloprotease [Paracoccaceae bacterium]
MSDYSAILSGMSWSETDATPTVVTYSFETLPQSYLGGTYSQAFIDSFQPFTANEIALAREALAQWAAACGLTFVEVAPGDGDIRFANYDFSLSSSAGAAGFAYYPGHMVFDYNTYEGALAGDVFIATAYMDASWLLDTLLHEIGHAIGLEHPHDGDIQLETAFDSTAYTVMSYNGAYAPTLGSFDIAAAQALYGPDDFAPDPDGGIMAFTIDEIAFSLDQAWGAASSQIAGTSLHDRIAAGAGDDLVGGFRGDDLLMGEAGADTLIGSDGADTLNGGPGDDILIGGTETGLDDGTDVASFEGSAAGVDVDLGVYQSGAFIYGLARGAETGNDTLYGIDHALGGDGDDTIAGNAAGNMLGGNGGDDGLSGLAGDDLLSGGDGADTLTGGAGADTLSGDAGDDVLIGGDTSGDRSGVDVASFAGATANLSVDLGVSEGPGGVQGSASGADIGSDTLYGIDNAIGGSGHDLLLGNGWGNALEGGGGRDMLIGLAGNDTLSGGDGDDTIRGNADHDLVSGGAGDDLVIGGTGRDTLSGDDGADVVRGNGGFDTVEGGDGDDLVAGGAQADLVLGGAGDDTLQGGGGFDTLDGGTGDDLLSGNFNADTFVFADGHGQDSITDFEATNAAEKIDLSAIEGIAGLADLDLGSATLGAATQVGADVVIDTGDGNSITLLGVDLADLDASDFIF